MRVPIDHFGLIARFYDRIFGRSEDDGLPELVAPEPGQRVLDVGGGTGRTAAGLIGFGATVIVCDRSLAMLRQARAKGLPAVLADVSHLPFASGSMPRVMVVDAFHHFVESSPEITQTLAASELLRVLQPGGRLLVEEPDIAHRGVRLIAWAERMLLMGSRFLSRDALAQWFARAGGRLVASSEGRFSVQLIFTREGDEPSAESVHRAGS